MAANIKVGIGATLIVFPDQLAQVDNIKVGMNGRLILISRSHLQEIADLIAARLQEPGDRPPDTAHGA